MKHLMVPRLRFSRDRSWSAEETRWLPERRNDSEVAVGQIGNNMLIPIIPIAARNPAGKMTGTRALPVHVSHPESDFRGKLRSRSIVYSETSDTYLEKIHPLQEVNRRSSCRRYSFIVCSYPQPRLGLPFLK